MKPIAQTTLAGRRVTLESLSLAHVDGLHAAASEDRSTYSLTTVVPKDRQGVETHVRLALENASRMEIVPFATLCDGRVVGATCFLNIERWHWGQGSPDAPPPGCADAVEIGGTWLAASAQRTCVNSEAKLLMLTHAFDVWGVRRVTLKTDIRNSRSRAAIERLGAKLDGLLRAHVPAADGGARTSAVYSILASEWPEIRARLAARLDTEPRRP